MRLTPDKKLHSREHLLADDLATMMGEPKKFAAYLGIAKRYYESDLRALARRVREKEDLPSEARGKYFFAALRSLTAMPAHTGRAGIKPIPGTKKKHRKKNHGKRDLSRNRKKSS